MNNEQLIQLLLNLQLSVDKPLTPCLYIQLTRFTNAPTLEQIVDGLGTWPEIEKKLNKVIQLNNKGYIESIAKSKKNKVVNKEEAISILKQYKCEQGEIITLPKYEKWRKSRKQDTPSAYQLREMFGSWGKVCEMGGLKARTRYTKAQLLYFLNAAREDHGRFPTSEEYYQWAITNQAPALRTIIKHYGSWKNAIRYLVNHKK